MTDSPSPELRALAERLFAAGRVERPGPALGRRLLLLEAAGTHAAGAPNVGAPGRASGAASRARSGPRARRMAWVGALALAAAFAGVWWSFGEAPAIVISPDPVARVRTSAPTPVEAHAPPRAGDAPGPREALVGPAGATSANAPVAADARAAAPSGARQRSSAAGHAPVPRSVLPSPAPHAQPVPGRAPASSVSGSGGPPPSNIGFAAPSAAPTAVPQLDLASQLALLKGARSALRGGDAGRALELLERDPNVGSGDGLHAEATLLRIEALDALGRRADASELAARFVRENPNSALGDRAKGFIIGAGREP